MLKYRYAAEIRHYPGPVRRSYAATARGPEAAARAPSQAAAGRPPREGGPTMVKHYLKYALSTLTAAMFLHMS